MEKIVSFIPIKLNNQRLPGKNLMDLEGKPLCNYLFDTINQVDTIQKKYVYCSDEKIKKNICYRCAQCYDLDIDVRTVFIGNIKKPFCRVKEKNKYSIYRIVYYYIMICIIL